KLSGNTQPGRGSLQEAGPRFEGHREPARDACGSVGGGASGEAPGGGLGGLEDGRVAANARRGGRSMTGVIGGGEAVRSAGVEAVDAAGELLRTTVVVSVVIPARNESRNIAWVLRRMPDLVDEVVLVDGHSDDDTVAVARAIRPDVVVLSDNGRGKGEAMRPGRGASPRALIHVTDADGSMDPAEIQ